MPRTRRIALCSPGMLRGSYTQTYGLLFLANLIKDRFGDRVEFVSIQPKDIKNITPGNTDVLLVSILGPFPALEYIKACGFKKPPVLTLIGGPGINCPLMLAPYADAVMLGRGEEAIFHALDGDFFGMCTLRTGTSENSVRIFPATLLDKDHGSCGCLSRCRFCMYSWGNVYASTAAPRKDLRYLALKSPDMELLLKDLHFSMLGKTVGKKCIVGLDVLQPGDQKIVRKPASLALLHSVFKRLGEEARQINANGRHFLRMYTISSYPWHRNTTLSYLENALENTEWPVGCSCEIHVGLSHFEPSLFTPLECCTVSLENDRQWLLDHRRLSTYKRLTGPYLRFFPFQTGSAKSAVYSTILARSADPYQTPRDLLSTDKYEDLLPKYENLIGWQKRMPAPWIQRVNDPRADVHAAYAAIREIRPDLDIPIPEYPEIKSENSRHFLPAYDKKII